MSDGQEVFVDTSKIDDEEGTISRETEEKDFKPLTALAPMVHLDRRAGGEFELGLVDGKKAVRPYRRPIGEPIAVMTPRAKQVSIGGMIDGKEATFPRGIVLINSKTGAGKSSMMRALEDRSQGRMEILTVVEPIDDETLRGKIGFHHVDDALAHGMFRWAENANYIPIIDSLRAPLFETTGAAGDKGVIMPFFTRLTRVSNALSKMGMTVFATINPMNENGVQQEYVSWLLKASLPAMLTLNSIEGGVAVGTMMRRDFDVYRKDIPFALPLTTSRSRLKTTVQPAIVVDDNDPPQLPGTQALSNLVK